VLLGRRFVGLDVDATAIARTGHRLSRVSPADSLQAALSLSEAPGRVMVRCHACGRLFPAQRRTAAYYGDTCRQRAHRQRHERAARVTVA
jgi:hypothetical protein